MSVEIQSSVIFENYSIYAVFFGVFFIWSTVALEDFIKGRITSPAIEKPRPHSDMKARW
jgi:hypothetical protein